MADDNDSGDPGKETFWLVDGDVAMLNRSTRGAARFFAGSGWKPVPAYSIEEEGVEITEADFDARFDAARKALKDGK